MKVVNISTSGSHYLIVVFYKDFSKREFHAYSTDMLNKKVTSVCKDKNVHDFYVYKGIDFDLKEDK